MNEYMEAICKNLLFQNMSRSEVESALFHLKPKVKRHEKGSYIVMMGESIKEIHLLLEGCVQIILEDAHGTRSIMSQYLPGDSFMEMLTATNTKTIPASALAVKDSVVASVYYENILKMSVHSEKIWAKILNNLYTLTANKNIILYSHLGHVSRPNIRGKIISYLQEQKDKAGKNEFLIPMSKGDMADYLFINRSAMTRELAAMKKEKLINFEGRKFTLTAKD